MNPKKEFVNAIMSVLRLEQNIYVTASIEEIIDRIDMRDYTMFIAYLGERNSDFERPIQTIAKATEDFYEKKNRPKRFAIMGERDRVKSIIEYSFEHLRLLNAEEGKQALSDIDMKATEITKFLSKLKSIGGINIKEQQPLIKELGGIKKLVEVFLSGGISLGDYIEKELNIKQYALPSISDKIDKKDFSDGYEPEYIEPTLPNGNRIPSYMK